jgi:hypothetical protein
LEQFYTTQIRQARIASFSQYVPDVLEPATASEPPLEEVTFVFQSIEWTHSNSGVTYQDSWLHGSGSAGDTAATPAAAPAGAGAGAALAASSTDAGASAFGRDQVVPAIVAGPPSRVARIVPLTDDDKGPETRLGLTKRDLPREVGDLVPDEERGVDVGVAPPYVPVGP